MVDTAPQPIELETILLPNECGQILHEYTYDMLFELEGEYVKSHQYH